jgi:hypothetical protein
MRSVTHQSVIVDIYAYNERFGSVATVKSQNRECSTQDQRIPIQ